MHICVHAPGNVRANIIVDALKNSDFDVYHTHVLKRKIAKDKFKENSHHHASVQVQSLLKQGKKVRFIVALSDPISQEIYRCLREFSDLDIEIEASALRKKFTGKLEQGSLQNWIETEVKSFLGVDLENLEAFDGKSLIADSKYGKVLFLKSELTSSAKATALRGFLNADIEVNYQKEKHSKTVEKLYSRIKSYGLNNEDVDAILRQPYLSHFYSQKDVLKIKKRWSNKLLDNQSLLTYSFKKRAYKWVCFHHMGNVGAEVIREQTEAQISKPIYETQLLSKGQNFLEGLAKKNPHARHIKDGISLFKKIKKPSKDSAAKGAVKESAKGKFVIVIGDPILKNILAYAARNRDIVSSESSWDSEERVALFTDAVPSNTPQIWISREILKFFGVKMKSLTQVMPGVLHLKTSKYEALIVANELSDAEMSIILSSYLDKPINISRDSKPFPVRMVRENLETFVSSIQSSRIPKDYVDQALAPIFIKRLYSRAQLRDISMSWEDTIIAKRVTKNISCEEFGKELADWSDRLESDERLFEVEGGFYLYGGRANIAAAKYWSANVSHKEDHRKHERFENIRRSNYDYWQTGEGEGFEEIDFSPNIDVAIHNISVEVNDIPIEDYPFLLGDGCLYYQGAEINERRDNHLPAPSEAHCTAISLRSSRNFLRSIELPEDLPIYLSKYEALDAPQHVARHKPHVLRQEDIDMIRVRARMKYRPYSKGMKVHKFIRIPYLDQYPFAPALVQENRPWYHAWDKQEPLKVKGFAVYFSPKAPILQYLEDLKVYAIDKNGKAILGKEITMADQDAGGHGESFSLSPTFVRGDLTINPGEYLSASAYLTEGTPAADLAFYILVEIPESKIDNAYGSPLFYSQGCANLDYLQNHYDADRREFISTPAAYAVLRSIAQTPLPPWSEEFGLDGFPRNKNKADKLYGQASRYVFIN